MELVAYGGWAKCARLSNGLVDMVITAEVGPRVIRFGFVGEANEFYEFPAQVGKTGGGEWRSYGGHRLWHAPEAQPRTYFPDNAPVDIQDLGAFIRVTPPPETPNGIQKQIDIQLDPRAAKARLTHRLINTGPWAVELAPWAISVMRAGGRAILPLPPRQPQPEALLPVNSMALWAYTDFSDPRWVWGKGHFMLKQDPRASESLKVGISSPDGWIAYANAGHLFVKQVAFDPGAVYPDFGCSLETFTNAEMLECETLGPLVCLQPGEATEHREDWLLFKDVPVPEDEAAIVANVLPLIHPG